MPPAKSWTPSSESPDSGEGTRDAPHGYRPWPNSGRHEPASVPRFRRPTLLDSLLEKIRTRQVVVADLVSSIAQADAIIVGRIGRKEAAAIARRLCRGQLVVLENPAGILAPFKKAKRRILLAWKRGRTFDGIDDDSRRAAEALVGALQWPKSGRSLRLK